MKMNELSHYYFSFGSNMSTWRISKNCPTCSFPAEFVDAAKLDNHVLQFAGPDWPSWNGAVANIAPTLGEHQFVWGVLWKLSPDHLDKLDELVFIMI